MKKLMIAFAVAAVAAFANAAAVNWKYSGTSSEKGYTVLLYTTAIESSYTSYSALTAGAVDSATVVQAQVGPTKYYKIDQRTAANAGIEKGDTLYYVIVKDSDATTYKYGSVSGTDYIYDPDAQESAKDPLSLNNASFGSSGTIEPEPTPEPTSAMLLLLGVAGLALKRKRA